MLVLFYCFIVVIHTTDDDANIGIKTCLTESTTIMIQHNWYFVTWKFTNFTELQYEGVAKDQDAIRLQITHACL